MLAVISGGYLPVSFFLSEILKCRLKNILHHSPMLRVIFSIFRVKRII